MRGLVLRRFVSLADQMEQQSADHPVERHHEGIAEAKGHQPFAERLQVHGTTPRGGIRIAEMRGASMRASGRSMSGPSAFQPMIVPPRRCNVRVATAVHPVAQCRSTTSPSGEPSRHRAGHPCTSVARGRPTRLQRVSPLQLTAGDPVGAASVPARPIPSVGVKPARRGRHAMPTNPEQATPVVLKPCHLSHRQGARHIPHATTARLFGMAAIHGAGPLYVPE